MYQIYVGCDWHLYSNKYNAHHPYRTARSIGRLADNYGYMIDDTDIFIFLGDLCDLQVCDRKKLAQVSSVIHNIKGYKIMCKGNHDLFDDDVYLELGFDEICDIATAYGLVFSHVPVRVMPNEVNIHAHLHHEKVSSLGYQHINAYSANFQKEDQPILVDTLLKEAPIQDIDYNEKWNKEVTEQFKQYTAIRDDVLHSKIIDISDKIPLYPVDEASAEMNEILFPDTDSTKYWEADDNTYQDELDAAEYSDARKPHKVRGKNDVFAESVINYHKVNGTLNTVYTVSNNHSLVEITQFATDVLDGIIQISPEALDRAELVNIKNAEMLINHLKEHRVLWNNWYSKSIGSTLQIDLISGFSNTTIPIESIASILPYTLTDDQFGDYIRLRIQELDDIQSLLNEALLSNLNELAIQSNIAKSISSTTDKKRLVKILKAEIDRKRSEVITKNRDGSYVFDYSIIQRGSVYISKSTYNEISDITNPSRFIGRLSYYDYIIISHGGYDKDGRWIIDPITIDGKSYTDIEKALDALHPESNRILVMSCNREGKKLNELKYQNVTYADTKVLYESVLANDNAGLSSSELLSIWKSQIKKDLKQISQLYSLILKKLNKVYMLTPMDEITLLTIKKSEFKLVSKSIKDADDAISFFEQAFVKLCKYYIDTLQNAKALIRISQSKEYDQNKGYRAIAYDKNLRPIELKSTLHENISFTNSFPITTLDELLQEIIDYDDVNDPLHEGTLMYDIFDNSNGNKHTFSRNNITISESTKEYNRTDDNKPIHDRKESKEYAEKYGIRPIGQEEPDEKSSEEIERMKKAKQLQHARAIKKRKKIVNKVKQHLPFVKNEDATAVDNSDIMELDIEHSPLYGDRKHFFYNYDMPKETNTSAEKLDESVTLPSYRSIAKRIQLYTESKENDIVGNQNCLLCTWAFELSCRGISTNPRPVYSPRDVIFTIKGENIVKNSVKMSFTSKDDVSHIVKNAGKGARFYAHVNWNGSTGGHEFIILNHANRVYIVDPQSGYMDDINAKRSDSYFDINYGNSYICRLDDKEINTDIIKYNNMKYLTKWNEDIDIPYMRAHNMLDESAKVNDMTRIVALNNELNDYQYGLSRDNQKIKKQNTTSEDYDKHYRVATPAQFVKQNGGICWDFATYEASVFKKQFPNIKFKTYYIVFDAAPYYPTHTFLVFEKDMKFYYFESSFKRVQGIWVADSISDIFNFVLHAMDQYRPKEYKASLLKYKYAIFEYNALHPDIPGSTTVEFMNLMEEIGQEIPHVYNSRYDVKPYIDTDDLTVRKTKTKNENDPVSSEAVKLDFYLNKEHIAEASISAVDTGKGFLYDLEVFKKYHGQGNGTKVMQYILSHYKVSDLSVDADNTPAIKLYTKFGFKRKKSFYDKTQKRTFDWYQREPILLDETSHKSIVDSNHKQHGQMNLNSLTRIDITEKWRKEHTAQYPYLKHIASSDDEIDASAWLDDDKLVAIISVDRIPSKRNKIWIHDIHIDDKYRGYGLSKQLLDYAINNYKANALAVKIDNKLAQKVYLDYGFSFGSGKDDTMGNSKIMYLNESSIQESYQFELLDKNVHFYDKIDETASYQAKGKLYPVYIMLVHSGTTVSNLIKSISHSEYSHASISFDSSLDHMYSFARKDPKNPFLGGFRYESIGKGFYDKKEIPYALYVVPCTEDQVKRMKKRLDYFVKNNSKFSFDFAGLVKNYIGYADEPEYRWFCSRFVADILNAGSPEEFKYIDEPSLMDPDDFKKTNFARFVIAGDNMMKYDRKLVDKLTKKILIEEKYRKQTGYTLAEDVIDPTIPYEDDILVYQLLTMDESVVDDVLKYLQSFKIKFDQDGNVIIHQREYKELSQHFNKSKRMLRHYRKTGATESIKNELCKLYYMINIIETYYLKPTTNAKYEERQKQMMDLRALMINVFRQNLNEVTAKEPNFNFQSYYNASDYGKDLKIPKTVIAATGKALITMLS